MFVFVTRPHVFDVQDSLGGNAKTVMVANISSAAACVKETASTLGFAHRAKMIKNTVCGCKTLHLHVSDMHILHCEALQVHDGSELHTLYCM